MDLSGMVVLAQRADSLDPIIGDADVHLGAAAAETRHYNPDRVDIVGVTRATHRSAQDDLHLIGVDGAAAGCALEDAKMAIYINLFQVNPRLKSHQRSRRRCPKEGQVSCLHWRVWRRYRWCYYRLPYRSWSFGRTSRIYMLIYCHGATLVDGSTRDCSMQARNTKGRFGDGRKRLQTREETHLGGTRRLTFKMSLESHSTSKSP